MKGMNLAFELVGLVFIGLIIGFFMDREWNTQGIAIVVSVFFFFFLWVLLLWKRIK